MPLAFGGRGVEERFFVGKNWSGGKEQVPNNFKNSSQLASHRVHQPQGCLAAQLCLPRVICDTDIHIGRYLTWIVGRGEEEPQKGLALTGLLIRATDGPAPKAIVPSAPQSAAPGARETPADTNTEEAVGMS